MVGGPCGVDYFHCYSMSPLRVVQGSTVYVCHVLLQDKMERIQKAPLPCSDTRRLAGYFRWKLSWLLFLRKPQCCLEPPLIDKVWLLRAAYLADIFLKTNTVSLSRKTNDSIYRQ